MPGKKIQKLIKNMVGPWNKFEIVMYAAGKVMATMFLDLLYYV